MKTCIDLKRALEIAEQAAREAGRYLMAHFGPNHCMYNKDDTPSGICSRFDGDSSEIIIKSLLEQWFEAYPETEVLIISEESEAPILAARCNKRPFCRTSYTDEVRDWMGMCWVIDPICGSVGYARGIRDFIISIALVCGNEALAAVVYDPPHDELFYAAKEQGAYLNGMSISPANTEKLSEAVVSVEHEYYRSAPLESIREIACAVRRLRTAMTCALELCYVACGRLDAVVKLNQAFYDYIGGALILTEALGSTQGLVRTEDGQSVLPFLYLGYRTGFYATNGLVLSELKRILSK